MKVAGARSAQPLPASPRPPKEGGYGAKPRQPTGTPGGRSAHTTYSEHGASQRAPGACALKVMYVMSAKGWNLAERVGRLRLSVPRARGTARLI